MKTVTIIVSGGLVQEVRGIPEGVRVIVRDYDVNDEADLQTDDDGEQYGEFLYHSTADLK